MPDPLHPSSYPPPSKPVKLETMSDGNEPLIITYKKENRAQNFLIGSTILQGKNASIKDENKITKPQLISLNKFETKSTQDILSQSILNIKMPSFLEKLRCKIRLPKLPSFGGFSFSKKKKMSDKATGSRPMKFPYTLSAKIAQFPFKFYINNNWMWKYYFIAVAVSFPVFYKLSRASNTPENVKVWEEIRKRDFAPGGHH